MRAIALLFTFFISTLVQAQVGDRPLDSNLGDSLLSIKELSMQGRHLNAVMAMEKSSGAEPLGNLTAAAKSAWALGLIDTSRRYWESVKKHPQCKGAEKARSLLAQSLMEIQEGEYETARSLAEEGASLLSLSELRGELWYVVGESLRLSKLPSLAEGYFERAVDEASYERKQEALLALSKVRRDIGKLDAARSSLIQVELGSGDTTISALKNLTDIDIQKDHYQGVLTWTKQGRETFPSDFSSSYVGYQRIQAFVNQDMVDEADRELSFLKKEVSENDAWLQLGRALYEERVAEELLVEDTESEMKVKTEQIDG